ncbi:MAG TPA: GspMb/PilO family protein [Kiritimatiellia bacterium]|jgi:hypothetical protein
MKNWQELTKEQKQVAVMSVVLGVIVIFLAVQFGLLPFLANKARMTEEFVALDAKLALATQAVKDEGVLRDTLVDKTRMLEQAYRDYIPAPENPLSWATKKIYGEARAIGVDIESVSELDSGDTGQWAGKDTEKRAFKPYAVRISLQCSFAQLVRLLRVLEERNPHMFVTDITIDANAGNVSKHIVSLVVEWPSWRSPDRIPNFSGKEAPAAPAAPARPT